jgi:hypothetical protein
MGAGCITTLRRTEMTLDQSFTDALKRGDARVVRRGKSYYYSSPTLLYILDDGMGGGAGHPVQEMPLSKEDVDYLVQQEIIDLNNIESLQVLDVEDEEDS